jgi:hypothetical protein
MPTVPGAVEAMYDGVPQRFLRFRDGAVVRLSDAERQEILEEEIPRRGGRGDEGEHAVNSADRRREG